MWLTQSKFKILKQEKGNITVKYINTNLNNMCITHLKANPSVLVLVTVIKHMSLHFPVSIKKVS